MMKNKNGFTLIELLVVISIIGVLATLVIANLNEARARAKDVKKKQSLTQLKTALRLYYNDFGTYPATGNGRDFNACGTNGTTACTPDGIFSAGSSSTVYMNRLVKNGQYFEFQYYPCASGENFRIKITLDNDSDPDLAASQARCPAATCGSSYSADEYVVCPD